jgi:diaminopimelate decarboxylase
MIAGELARELVDRFGAPLYAYDLDEVDRRVAELRGALPEGSTLLYSLKANPLPAIVALVAAQGLGAEVSSPGELQVALRAGIEPDHVLYTGPGKTGAEVEEAVARGVSTFSCESRHDYERVAGAAAARRRRVRVLFRLNVSARARYRLAMAGGASQFGFEEDALRALLGRIEHRGRYVETLGLHVYGGTQIQGVDALAESFAAALDAAREIFARADVEPRVIDLGGGFPWPYATDGERPDLAPLRPALAALLGAAGGVRYWFESGRFVCASSGTLVATVVDVKESRGKRFVVLDAGINHLGGMAGLGRIHLPKLSLRAVARPEASDGEGGAERAAGATERVTVTGPLCSPLDVLARDVETVPLRPGDIVTIPNVGAYGATASLTGFLGRLPAAEVTHRGHALIEAYRLRHGHEQVRQAQRLASSSVEAAGPPAAGALSHDSDRARR